MTFPLRATLATACISAVISCSSQNTTGVDSRIGSENAPLLARSSALWPSDNCTVTVRVCWAPPILQTVFPVSSLAPDVATAIGIHKKWVQSIVESQWNARTPVQFVGWNDCSVDPADVKLTPIDSSVTAPCGTRGQSCVEYLGQELRGHSVFLNMLFGDEVLYSSRYEQANPGLMYNQNNDLAYWWIPQACFDDFRRPWSTNNTLTQYPVDINQPAVMDKFNQIYQNCLQFGALHEFGHAAGFAHELQRGDAPKSPPNNGVACQLPGQVDVQFMADTPLGAYDAQSIMNYCRTDNTATLSPEDVQETNAVYCPTGGGIDGGVDGGIPSLPTDDGGVDGGTPSLPTDDGGVDGDTPSLMDAGAEDSGETTGVTPRSVKWGCTMSHATSGLPAEMAALGVGAWLVVLRRRRRGEGGHGKP